MNPEIFESRFKKLSEEEREELARQRRERIEGIARIDKRFKEYWENYTTNSLAQANIHNIISLNRDAVYLYEIENEQERRLNHVIWIYNKSEELLYTYETIPQEAWKDLTKQPEIIEEVNKLLIETYNSAIHFYNWRYKPKGFVIEGSKHFGMEAGDIGGIRISYRELMPLIEAIKAKNKKEIDRQQKHLAASIVHELTHLERDDGLISQIKTEIASHIVQFIFNPKNNEIFNQQLEYSLNRIAENKTTKEQQNPLSLYEKAQYIALLIIADELAQYNKVFWKILENDEDPYKLNALKKLQELIDLEAEKYLKSQVLPRIMQMDSNKLMERFREIENKFGIQKSIIEI